MLPLMVHWLGPRTELQRVGIPPVDLPKRPMYRRVTWSFPPPNGHGIGNFARARAESPRRAGEPPETRAVPGDSEFGSKRNRPVNVLLGHRHAALQHASRRCRPLNTTHSGTGGSCLRRPVPSSSRMFAAVMAPAGQGDSDRLATSTTATATVAPDATAAKTYTIPLLWSTNDVTPYFEVKT